jgi:hypothetical protein
MSPAVHPLLPVTAALERTADKKLRHYLPDVQDHLLLTDDEVAAQRDLLGTILEANMVVRGGLADIARELGEADPDDKSEIFRQRQES